MLIIKLVQAIMQGLDISIIYPRNLKLRFSRDT